MSNTIAFFGASSGCGLFALKHAVAAGHTCIALCRTPSKLDAHFPEKPANLIVKAGNAHNAEDLMACLTKPSNPTQMVDSVYFTIGGAFNPKNFTIDDPDVCKKGITALYEALEKLRSEKGVLGRPLLAIGSTTGISKHKRDVPLMFMPMYSIMLKMPHEDKKVMEQKVIEGTERYILVRPSFLCDGAKPERKIRVGVEDPTKGVEQKEVGYVISREDVGRWVFENCLAGDASKNQFEGKAVGITW